MSQLNAAVISTSRADYGILTPLLKKLNYDSYFNLSLIVTGTHLSKEHGYTINEILKDGFNVSFKVDLKIIDDKPINVCESIATGINEFSKIYLSEMFDCIIVLGDRYELWAACIPAVMNRIPIVHIHGGEVTAGLIDDPVRHSITKMASIHFPSIKEYADRIIRMGETPDRVFTVGAMGVENVLSLQLINKKDIYDKMRLKLNTEFVLMTYHPVTLDDYEKSMVQAENILKALLKTTYSTVITMPNSDTGGMLVYRLITSYIQKYPDKFILIKNFGQIGYLSAMKYSKFMIGNSSSGILESASFSLPTINVGDRQKGRFKPQNVIDCSGKITDVSKAIEKAISKDFLNFCETIENPYGDGRTSDKIIEKLKQIDFKDKETLLKKGFYD